MTRKPLSPDAAGYLGVTVVTAGSLASLWLSKTFGLSIHTAGAGMILSTVAGAWLWIRAVVRRGRA